MSRRTVPLVALALPALATAGHGESRSFGRCGSAGQPALGLVEVAGGEAWSAFYVDDRSHLLGNGVWRYEESNGVWFRKPAGACAGEAVPHDLQRGSMSSPTPEDSEICADVGDWSPDTLLF